LDNPREKEIKKINTKNQAHLKKCAFCIKSMEKIIRKQKTEKVIFCDGRHKKHLNIFLEVKLFRVLYF